MNAPGSPLPPVLAAAFDAGAFLMRYPDVAGWCLAAVKSSVIVLMALTLASLFRRRSAVARCWILRLAFPALVMTALWPFAAGHLPVLFVRLQAPAPVESRVETAGPVPPAAPRPEIIRTHEREMPRVQEPDAVNAAPPVPVAPTETAVPERAPIMAEPAWKAWAGWWEGRLLPAWLGGALLAAMWMCARNLAGLFWLHARGVPAGGNITIAGDALTDLLRMKRGTYRLVPGLASPLLTGWFRPRLWLPPDAAQMAEPQVRAILHHELAHHRRKDLQWQALASLACAIWWWNPFVWSLRKRLRNEAELAADEAVVSGSGLAADYAELLVRVASGWTADDTRMIRRTGVPMMGSSSIERRVRAILAENPFRNRMGWTAGVVVAFIAIMGAGIASLTAIAQPAEPEVRKPLVVERLPSEAFGDVKAVKILELMQRESLRPTVPDYLHPPSAPDFIRDASGPQDYSAMERLDAQIAADFPEQSSAGPIRSNSAFPNGFTPGGGEINTTRAAGPGEGEVTTEIYLNGRYVGSTGNSVFPPSPATPPVPQPESILFRFIDSKKAAIPHARFNFSTDTDIRHAWKPQDAVADDKGTFRFKLPQAGMRNLRIQAAHQGYASHEIWLQKREPGWIFPDAIDIRLERTSAISGRILDEDGKPVAGAEVTAQLRSSSSPAAGTIRSVTYIPEMKVVTNAAGEWKLDGFPENLEGLMMLVRHPVYRVARGLPNALLPHSMLSEQGALSLRDGTSVITLRAAPLVEGRVVDGGGNAISGARVVLAVQRDGDLPVSLRTDAAGAFRYQDWNLPAGVNLTVEADGFRSRMTTIWMKRGQAPSLITMGPKIPLRGRLVKEDGTPAADTEVKVDGWKWRKDLDFRTRTDAAGRFIWPDAPEGPLSFTFGGGEGQAPVLSSYPVPAGDEEQVIVLKPFIRIRGRAVDAATGAPIGTFTVTPGRNGAWRKTSRVGSSDGRAVWESSYATDAGISFLIEADGYEPLRTGSYPNDLPSGDQVWRLKRR